MPGVGEEINDWAEHGDVPVEKPLGAVRKDFVVVGLGVDASVLEEVFKAREVTIRPTENNR